MAEFHSDDVLESSWGNGLLYVLSESVALWYFLKKTDVIKYLKSSASFSYCLTIAVGICFFVFGTVFSGIFNTAEWVKEDMALLMGTPLGILAVCCIVPVSEEIVFRYAITFNLLRWKRNSSLAISVSSLLFAVLHFNPVAIPFYFLFGIFAGWIVIRTGSLLPAVLLHMTNNILCTIEYYIVGDGPSLYERTGCGWAWMAVAVAAVIAAMCIFILNKKTSLREAWTHKEETA